MKTEMALNIPQGIPGFTKNQVWWEVYEGDIRRKPLFWKQRWHNLKAHFRFYFTGKLPEIYHRGEILNRKIKTLYGENTVVTLGKQIMLDRLYALNGPPAALADTGVGTENTASGVGDTKLNPAGGGTVLFLAYDALPTRLAQTVTSQTTFGTAVANFIWAECGMANSTVNDGTHLFNRVAPIGPFTKTAAVSIIVIFAVTAN